MRVERAVAVGRKPLSLFRMRDFPAVIVRSFPGSKLIGIVRNPVRLMGV